MERKTLISCFNRMAGISLNLCILFLCGCNCPRQTESDDTIDSLTKTSVIIDTAKEFYDIVDTNNVDSLATESDCNINDGDKGGTITWHHFSKTLYEVEFINRDVEESIIEYIDSVGKRWEDLRDSRVVTISIGPCTYDVDLTAVTIESMDADQDGIDLGESSNISGFGYSVLGERIALVSPSTHTINTGQNPRQMDFKYYTTTSEGLGFLVFGIVDREYLLTLDLGKNKADTTNNETVDE